MELIIFSSAFQGPHFFSGLMYLVAFACVYTISSRSSNKRGGSAMTLVKLHKMHEVAKTLQSDVTTYRLETRDKRMDK